MSHQHPPLILLQKEDDNLSFIEKFIPIFNLNLDVSYLKSGKQINLTRITSAPHRRGVGGDVLSHQHTPLILLQRRTIVYRLLKKFIPIFNLNLDIRYLKSGKQINLTRITSAPL